MSFSTESDVAALAARRAGALLLKRVRAHGEVVLKGGDSREPVTDADLAADLLIREALGSRFPDDDILTEESDHSGGHAARRWVVDPLDGTANYVAGLPFWAVSIALQVDADCSVGVVYDAERDELFGIGAEGVSTCNGAPMGVGECSRVGDAVVSVLLKPSAQAEPELMRLITQFRGVRQLGATALELAWVAAGRLDACLFRKDDRPWDWAPGARLVQGAGGAVIPWGDRENRAFIAASPSLAQACQPQRMAS